MDEIAEKEEAGVVVIEPPRRWPLPRLAELWEYRELLFFFVWRDVKIRYKQTVFGVGWAVLQPLLMMVVFTIFLGRLAGIPSDGVPYPLFAYCGLVPWTLFAQSLNLSSVSLVTNANLVSKIFFPRILLPLGATASFLIDFGIALILLLGLMAYYGISPSMTVLFAPFFVFLALFTSLAVGIWLSALNARYRDVQYAVPFIIQVWLFATPVAYPSSLVEGRWRVLFGLNPMAGVVEGFRWTFLGTGQGVDLLILVSGCVTLLFLLGAVIYFRRVETTIADVI